ncbi:conserved domain [Cryptosporidium sp. chipmunk genotype I]|uniref:conserved domain n=1 Tax=Cryptosporidium sp. chipmunk genotype I TaxID=1280935 RepID=UPI00351A5BD6|nr:conserved domain [Cryptosporidium sp. chipmunk genotype I]
MDNGVSERKEQLVASEESEDSQLDDEISRKLIPFETNIEFDETQLPEETRQIINQNTRELLRNISFSNSGGLKGAIERSYLVRQQSLAHTKEEVVDAYKQRARLAAMVSRRRVTLQHVRAQFEAVAKFKKGLKHKDKSDSGEVNIPIKSKTEHYDESNEDFNASFEASSPIQKESSTSFVPVRFGSMSISDTLALQQLANMKIGSRDE